jgi:hypothetical protein
MYTEGLQLKVKELGREELERLAVQALFHLRCLSASRNSYDPEYLEAVDRTSVGLPYRTPTVENMHTRAAEFIRQVDA